MRAFLARKKGPCKLIGNRFVIPHDTIPSTLGVIVEKSAFYSIFSRENKKKLQTHDFQQIVNIDF
jgi:hypothetical protein